MSISSSLANAVSGMNAASKLAEVVSSNVSNSLTDGYGRRSLNLSAASIGGVGSGVEVGSVMRHADRGLIADRRLADASLGNAAVLVSNLKRVEDVIGQAGQPGSISSRIVAVETALIDAATDPSSVIRLTSVSDRLNELASGLNDASGRIQDLRVDADASIADQVGRLNTALSQVERLNSDIMYARNNGIDPSGSIDERQKAIDKIAEIVPVREFDRDHGQVALMTPAGEMLIDGKAKAFEFTHNAVITHDMTLASGGLLGISFDGTSIASDGLGKLAGGTLGAAFQARDVELVAAQTGLDTIAADLIIRLQDPNVDPSLSVGQPGLLTVGGTSFAGGSIAGLAGKITLNANVDSRQGGTTTNIRDGVNAITAGLSGNASLLQSLSAVFAAPLAVVGSPLQQSAASRASSFEAQIGGTRLNFESELSFANARWSSFKEAEAAGGVDTDYEMQMLLRVEQAYAANARVIQTVDNMIQRLLEI